VIKVDLWGCLGDVSHATENMAREGTERGVAVVSG
jgi:hypothetical protein